MNRFLKREIIRPCFNLVGVSSANYGEIATFRTVLDLYASGDGFSYLDLSGIQGVIVSVMNVLHVEGDIVSGTDYSVGYITNYHPQTHIKKDPIYDQLGAYLNELNEKAKQADMLGKSTNSPIAMYSIY